MSPVQRHARTQALRTGSVPRGPGASVAFALFIATSALSHACGGGVSDQGIDTGAGTRTDTDAGPLEPKGLPPDAGSLPGPGQEDAAPRPKADARPGEGGAPTPDATDIEAVCTPGEEVACQCASADGMSLPGVKVCLEASGQYSQCGCFFEHPYPGPTCQGGQRRCRPPGGEPTQYSAVHCCTDGGKCGLKNQDVTGGVCIETGRFPKGKATQECGETIIPFVEVEDCCLPGGQCGLWLQQSNNWDGLGCVPRTEMAALLKNSGTLGFFLFLIGRSDVLDKIEPKTCPY